MNKIGWFLIGDQEVGSSRIGGLNIHAQFLREQIKSEIIESHPNFHADILLTPMEQEKILNKGYTTFIFQKIHGDRVKAFVEKARKKGIQTIYACGDWHSTSMYSLCDKVICSSSYMCNIIRAKPQTNPYWIEDGLEIKKTTPIKIHKHNRRPTLAWYGNKAKIPYVKNFISSLGTYELKIISNDESADLCMGFGTKNKWNTDLLNKFLLKHADIVVVPIDTRDKNEAFAKSANRILLPMALGIPTIATPIPSYEKIIIPGRNGFLPKTPAAWQKNLIELGCHLKRGQMTMEFASSIRKKYSIKQIADQYLKIIEEKI